MIRFFKVRNAVVNIKCIQMIQHCSGNVYEVVLFNGNKLYCVKEDADKIWQAVKGECF